jgi:phytoene desaturase
VTGFVGKVKKPRTIIVIGAGMGGMTAAARLARVGHNVTILEASDRTGGKCRTEWIGRYAFDIGPTLMTIPAVYRDFFSRTGKPMGFEMKLQEVEPSFHYKFQDGKEVEFANLSRKKTLENIESSLGKDAAEEWNRILLRAEAMWDVSRENFIEKELKSPLQLLKRKNFYRDFRIIAPHATLRDFAISSPYLSKILDRYATYSGSDPRKAPAVLSTIAFIEEAFGAWHIEGGIGTLSAKTEERCRNVGVDIRLNTRVEEIKISRNRVSEVRLSNGEVLQADVVISNADASLTYNTLIQTNTRKVARVRKQISRVEPSVAGFSIFLGMRPGFSLPHHTVLFPENYDEEFNSIFTLKKPVEKPAIYLCAPHDPSMVKAEGHSTVGILINAPIHSKNSEIGFDWSDRKFAQEYANSILSQIEESGIPIRDFIDVMEIRTPFDLENSVSAPGGAIYGTSSNGPRAAFMRAKNRSPIKNLYLVGGSAHPGGGLPLVGLSGEMVYDAIMESELNAPSSQSSQH